MKAVLGQRHIAANRINIFKTNNVSSIAKGPGPKMECCWLILGLMLAGGGLETRSWQLRETPDPYCLETGTEGQMGSMMLSPNLFPHLPLEGNLEGVRGTGGGRLSVPHSGGSD